MCIHPDNMSERLKMLLSLKVAIRTSVLGRILMVVFTFCIHFYRSCV
ncbi:hypothetical protein CRENPOLYSF2_4560002 [Crenothrix polyspora]|uniref:Uncharacterized protein n=1 Tax=Crenothrix polyspora TaxID=360316 RepID=A0A1R4HFQ2_9GAMM|nr:hypothetical protein CRENPOLYSF2_4560002 [Crenothrix polyspora]